MKSITIHGVDDCLVELIQSKAHSEGLSISQTIKKILEASFDMKPRQEDSKRIDFREFCGIWPEADLADLNDNTKEFR